MLCHTIDVVPTLVALAGGTKPAKLIWDRQSIRPLVTRSPGCLTSQPQPSEEVICVSVVSGGFRRDAPHRDSTDHAA